MYASHPAIGGRLRRATFVNVRQTFLQCHRYFWLRSGGSSVVSRNDICRERLRRLNQAFSLGTWGYFFLALVTKKRIIPR